LVDHPRADALDQRERIPAVRAATLTLLALVAIAARAIAAGPPPNGEPPIPAEIVRMKVESANFSPSKASLDVVIGADIAEGWHVNAHEPTAAWLVPTTLSVTPPAGFRVGDVAYPEPELRALKFSGGERLKVYGGHVRFVVPLVVESGFTREGASFSAKLRYQACDDTRCLKPTDVERTFVVKRPADAESNRPAGDTGRIEDWLSRYGLAPTLVLVFFMGLALNLTPCVYPLISVTIAYFGGQARERRRAIALSIAYALGIAVTFSALGVSAALSGSLFGRALQSPAVLLLIAGLMAALALASFGVYALRPPAWIMHKAGGSAGGILGALFMGLTMGIVAAPCVGPIVVGLLLAVGARGDALFGFVLFFTLAIGLGAPYVVLGAAAGSIARLPRSGEWLVWIEKLFGFVLLGLALYFVSPLLAGSVARAAAAGLVGCAAVTLGFLDPSGTGLPRFRFFKRVLGVAGVVAAIWVAIPAAGSRGDTVAWRPFSAEALAEASAERRPAVVDFRADWCMPCLEMERTTFVSPEVIQRAGDFVMLRADVTESSAATEALLSKYGVLGVPTTLFFARDGTERHRSVGYVDAGDFGRMLEDTRAGDSRADVAVREEKAAATRD